MDRIELRSVPCRAIIEAYISGAIGGSNSHGGLDGQGPMVTIDLESGQMVALPGFQERLAAWRKAGGKSPCPLNEMPTLSTLNSLVNGDGAFYDIGRCLIVNNV